MQDMGVIRPQQVQERYGISAESFNDIQQKLDHNAHQRDTQRAAAEARQAHQSKDAGQITLAQSELILKLKDALEYQLLQFNRFRELTEQKFTSLSKDLLDVTMQLKDARETIHKIKDKEDVQVARERLRQYQQGDLPPPDRPIDRNGVAPSQVQIQDIFNCAGKRY